MADKGQTIVRIKVLLIGPSNSGKTTFLKAITSNDALNVYTPTNGTAFYNHTSKMLSPAAELFIHFVDTSEAAVSSKEYLGALMNRTNFCIVFFECFNKESVAKAQNMILTIRELASTNNLPVPA
jgi:GTPase SAR1 family protein